MGGQAVQTAAPQCSTDTLVKPSVNAGVLLVTQSIQLLLSAIFLHSELESVFKIQRQKVVKSYSRVRQYLLSSYNLFFHTFTFWKNVKMYVDSMFL